MHHEKKDENKCVKVDIFVKCNNDCRKRKENEEPCVEVNIHVDCEECKKHNEECKDRKNPKFQL
jgi:hypothetical protein